jgi:hypothetical protein
VTACLPDAAPVEGRRLFAGRNLESISFLGLENRIWVAFEQRKSEPTPGRGGLLDSYLVAWDDATLRPLNTGRSDRWGVQADALGFRYYMNEERTFSPTSGAAGVPVATLVQVSLTAGRQQSWPDVSSYQTAGAAIIYRQMVAGRPQPQIHWRLADGRDRVIGEGNGMVQPWGGEKLYYIDGDERVLTRLSTFDGAPERLRARVSRHVLRNDERWAVVTATDMGRPRTFAMNLETRFERTLPGNPCCWLSGLDGSQFTYAEAAMGGTPAKLHYYNVETGEDQVIEMPPGLVDVSTIVRRPESQDVLYIDSQRRIALERPRPEGGEPERRLLEIRPLAFMYTGDGTRFLYVDPEVLVPEPEGPIMILDGELSGTPRRLTPKGARARAPGRPYFFITGPEPFVFWAHFGRGPSDLYFGNHETGASRIVGPAISQVTVTPRRIVGVMRVSLQDLTGEFVQKNPVTGEELVLAAGVSDLVQRSGDDRVVFVVRERVKSSRDGLWARRLCPGERPPDGGAEAVRCWCPDQAPTDAGVVPSCPGAP